MDKVYYRISDKLYRRYIQFGTDKLQYGYWTTLPTWRKCERMARWQDLDHVPIANGIPILRRSRLSPEVAWRDHVVADGDGLPVVVTDATDGWKARELWSAAYFAQVRRDRSSL